MNKAEYKNLRKILIKEYDDGVISSEKLGKKLLRLTDVYRKANKIARSK